MKIDLIDGIVAGALITLLLVMAGVQGYLYGYQKAVYNERDVIVMHKKNCNSNYSMGRR